MVENLLTLFLFSTVVLLHKKIPLKNVLLHKLQNLLSISRPVSPCYLWDSAIANSETLGIPLVFTEWTLFKLESLEFTM